jgi:hypothetical protein
VKLIIILTMLVAMAFPIKAQARSADAWVDHWATERHEHLTAKRWVKHHPQFFTFKRWSKTLRLHTRAIEFATAQMQIWKYRTRPPHYSSWLCIHRGEGSWSDSGDPYWGGLQMDRGFMDKYAPNFLLRKGWANNWTPREQMWVGERALQAGRGFYPWPNTAKVCGLI